MRSSRVCIGICICVAVSVCIGESCVRFHGEISGTGEQAAARQIEHYHSKNRC